MRILTGQGYSNGQIKHGNELLKATRSRKPEDRPKPSKGQTRELRRRNLPLVIIRSMTHAEAQAAIEEYWRLDAIKRNTSSRTAEA